MRLALSGLLLLLLPALPLRAAAAAPAASLSKKTTKQLQQLWQDEGSVDAGRELIARARVPGPGQWEALAALSLTTAKTVPAFGALEGELDALARETGRSADPEVRTFAGSLGQALQSWRARDSPQALEREKSFERGRRLDDFKEAAELATIPLLALLGIGWSLVSRGAIVALLLGSSTALSRAFGDAGEVVEREHRAMLLIPAATAVTSVVLGVTLWEALRVVTPDMASLGVPLLVWRVLLSARVLVCYFCAGFAFYFMHAVFLGMLIDVARGTRPDFGRALRQAARRWGAILALSAAVFGGVLAAEYLVAQARAGLGSRSPRALRVFGPLLSLAAWLVQTGLALSSVVVLAVAVGDGVGLLEASRRAGRLLTAKVRPALLAMLGIEAAGGDAIAGVFGLLFMAGLGCVMVFADLARALFPHARLEVSTAAGAYWAIIFGPMAVCILAAALLYSGLLALESIFAAAMYSYASDDKVQGPIYKILRMAAPQMQGTLAMAQSLRGGAAARSKIL